MRLFALPCALTLLCCLPAWGQGNTELMQTPECQAARKQLDEALAAGGPRDRLNAAREQAALKCFGVKPGPPPEGRFVPPPVSGDPIRLRPEAALFGAPGVSSAPGALAQPAPPPPPVVIARPPVVTSCDASGCWDTNGARYNQLGPMLMGPRGACTLQAGVLNCP